ncbi:DUF2605 domain-containing protein [filamentous cyanobacterium CCP5]|nr:DUF2605 domain-containing protein [filamentous cyanobacterium CCP5]
MSDEKELMQSVLEPLLEDFRHWFERSLDLFESETVAEIEADQPSDLVAQVKTALTEVRAAQALFQATDGQVGVEAAKVMGWHRLVHACWGVAHRHRHQRPNPSNQADS